MFPDSVIAKEFNKLSREKLSYMINRGLAPYFKNQIMLKLSPQAPRLPPKFTSSHVSYYDEKLKRVKRVYLSSQFMGHNIWYIWRKWYNKWIQGGAERFRYYKQFNPAFNGWPKCQPGNSFTVNVKKSKSFSSKD